MAEVLQEKYIKVWQNAERFTPEAGKPIASLLTSARNRATDRSRAERSERQRSNDDQAILGRLPSPSSDEPAERLGQIVAATKTLLHGDVQLLRDCPGAR